MKLAINLYGLHAWFGGDLMPVVDLVRLADRKGIDTVDMGEHVAMGDRPEGYPFGQVSLPPDFAWSEPVTLLAGIASVTERIRLSTGILIAPLRPAVVLAKQLATLDVLSRGRVDIGFGVGWQKAEYDACGVSFAGRTDLMEEQVRACKALWRDAPASFHGRYVRFDRIHSRPFPRQPGGIPIWFGVPPTAHHIALIAALGDGWLPLGLTRERFAEGVRDLRAAFLATGRDPDALTISHRLIAGFRDDGSADIEEALGHAPGWLAAGATMIELYPCMFCRGPDDFESFLDRIVAFRAQASGDS